MIFLSERGRIWYDYIDITFKAGRGKVKIWKNR